MLAPLCCGGCRCSVAPRCVPVIAHVDFINLPRLCDAHNTTPVPTETDDTTTTESKPDATLYIKHEVRRPNRKYDLTSLMSPSVDQNTKDLP